MASQAEMVETIRQYGVSNERVLQAINRVDRKKFVPILGQPSAYADGSLEIGFGQTISQPYTVARMGELLIGDSAFVASKSKILEIGTGSGWQTAVLSRLFKRVYSIERIQKLADWAQNKIYKLGIKNVQIKVGDGKLGWPEYAPYQGIIVAADAGEVPLALITQLAEGGRIVIPVKGDMQRGTKVNGKISWQSFGPFSFVPLV